MHFPNTNFLCKTKPYIYYPFKKYSESESENRTWHHAQTSRRKKCILHTFWKDNKFQPRYRKIYIWCQICMFQVFTQIRGNVEKCWICPIAFPCQLHTRLNPPLVGNSHCHQTLWGGGGLAHISCWWVDPISSRYLFWPKIIIDR